MDDHGMVQVFTMLRALVQRIGDSIADGRWGICFFVPESESEPPGISTLIGNELALVICYIAIENIPFIVDLPIQNGDFYSYVSLPEGITTGWGLQLCECWLRGPSKYSYIIIFNYKYQTLWLFDVICTNLANELGHNLVDLPSCWGWFKGR
jgi:hypothetical protein